MGGKRTRARKHVYFCFTGVIFLFSLLGCSLPKDIPSAPAERTPPGDFVSDGQDQGVARQHLLRSQKLLALGDFQGSLQENQKVLSLAMDGAPAEEALFNMGLIYAHVGNPARDHQKSLGLFKKLIKDHPRSLWVEQAKAWAGVLEANEKLRQANEKLNEVIKKSKQVDIEIEEKKRDQQK